VRAWAAAHRRTIAAAAAALLVVFGAAIWWLAPWKLFLDERAADPAPPPTAQVLASGAFRSLEHETTGTAKVLSSPDGSRTLRLEDLRTSNGPELVVMLSATPATEDGWSAYDDGPHLVLEPLKGNLGSQSYPIPGDVDLAAYRSAVVWCNRFHVGFGAAPIVPAAAER
jgi:hypothetical protein